MEFETTSVNVTNVRQLIGLKLKGAVTQNRLPTHFILLVDTSGSMQIDSRLRSVKNSIEYLMNFLTPADRISIVTFSNNAENILVNQAVTIENRLILLHHISNINATGSTNLSAGLLNVRDILRDTVAGTNAMKTGLVILTDGHANIGMNSQEQLNTIVHNMKIQHSMLSVNTIGYGTDHNGHLLRSMALEGGGAYSIVHSEEHVATVFGSILGGLVSCVAQNVEITIPSDWEHFTPYNVKVDGNFKKMFVGDIYSETETVLLFRGAGEAKIKWFSCLDMKDNNETARWPVDGMVANQAPYRVCYIRFRISELLDAIRMWIHDESGDNRRDAIREEINVVEHMINLISGDIVGQEAVLELLRGEIAQMREDLSVVNHMDSQLNDTQFIQRSAFIATGRGVSSQRSDGNDTVMSPFSNRVQRSITTGIQNARMSQTVAADPVDNISYFT
uniref:VWFA domain-containing protein n=1 Tax=viral metagenome TaxID=1070528 RepID=A0A6C0ICH6_9ZZZZ